MSFYDFFNKSIDQQREGDLAGAEESLKTAVKMAPQNHNCWNRLSIVPMEQKKWIEAEAAYSTTLEIFPSFDIVDPNSPNALKAMKDQLGRIYFNRGFIRIKQLNQKKTGIADWEKAVDFGNPDAIQGLSEL